ncbi:spore coat protein U domain-containing protein [Stenotrophomonas sp. MMGLT7]|uniref:Csu type fimbrial protein n=1 Tax=Stenotrophomonas sp. MMGLT7 TaxID=2901227 RepID=UPI001E42C418|nr:spore coat protein U domain-containing protein [Stenotrophomonas sp. MMGLT7]MCD7098975.1 spore coat U domain-containing protein [Stenotrophomonas sp. MMGLT7]
MTHPPTKRMRNLIPHCLLLLALCALCPRAWSQACSASSGAADFGSIDSISLYNTAQTTTAGSGFTCDGGALVLIVANQFSANLLSSTYAQGGQPRMYSGDSGDYVGYRVYLDEAYANQLQIGGSYQWSITSILGLLGLFSGPSGDVPLYLRTDALQNVAAGSYVDSLALQWSYNVCTVGALGICLVSSSGTLNAAVAVNLVVSDICVVVDAPDVDFGSAMLPSSFPGVEGALQVRCTKAAAYSVGLTSTDGSGDWRQMQGTDANNAAYTLQYRISRSDGTAWSESNDLSDTGTGLAQSLGYTAMIDAEQGNRPAGSYSDTVTVTVSY